MDQGQPQKRQNDDNLCPSQDSHHKPSKYRTEALLLKSTCLGS